MTLADHRRRSPTPFADEWRLRFATNDAAKGWGDLWAEADHAQVQEEFSEVVATQGLFGVLPLGGGSG